MSAAPRHTRAAEMLLSLRRPGARPRSLPSELAPQTEAEAYQVQQEFVRLAGVRIEGWKATMLDAQCGTSAPLFAQEIHTSPAAVNCIIGEALGIEPEVAFVLKRDLLPLAHGALYRREQLIDAIACAHAAIEIVVSRFETHEGAQPLDRLADNISNGGLVLSAPCRDWRALDLVNLPLRLTLQAADGTRTEQLRRGGHPLGDPLLPLLWLVNARALGGASLRAGEVITTGSYAGLHHAPRGTHVVVEFTGLGTAVLEVS